MIVDDVEGFLKFLDDVSYQLACLLDIDEPRQQQSIGSGIGGANDTTYTNNTTSNTTKKAYNRRKDSHTTKSRSNNKSKHLISNASSITNKRQSNKLQQSTRAKGKRKVAKLDELLNDINIHHTNNNSQDLSTSLTNNDSNALIEQNQQHQLLQHQAQQHQHTSQPSIDAQQEQQHQTNKLQHQQQHSANNINQTNLDTHTLDGQLTLNIADELPLDHVASISPTTHLSPIDSTIQFNNLHSQHYYTPPQRGVGHLDSYHLHDDFNSSHDQIPITNQTQHLSQEQHRQHIVNHQHLINHHAQPSSTLRVDSLSDATTGLNSNDCYQHPHHIHHHSHTPQYHQLDQQWLAPTPHGSDNTLQLGQVDSSTLDHVVSISPTSHQSLDQVQFNTPIYHHSYYNHQVEQLDSFHQMTDDYVTNPGSSIAVSSSSLSNHTHRMQQDQHQDQHQHQHHQQQHQSLNQHSNVLRMSSLDSNNGNNINGNNNNNTYDQHQVQHHQHQHNERQQQHQHQQHTLVHSQSEHQIHDLNQSNYHNNETSHHLHNQHLQQQHQMMPLMNGLVEPSGVIIQDINLASATWSSPEDLYSI